VLGVCAAVEAREVTRLGHLPKDEEWAVVEASLEHLAAMITGVNNYGARIRSGDCHVTSLGDVTRRGIGT